MTFNVVSWKGVLMPEVQEPTAMLMKLLLNFPPMNFMRFLFTSVIFVMCDSWLTRYTKTQVRSTAG